MGSREKKEAASFGLQVPHITSQPQMFATASPPLRSKIVAFASPFWELFGLATAPIFDQMSWSKSCSIQDIM
jgi:hypothetical protein